MTPRSPVAASRARLARGAPVALAAAAAACGWAQLDAVGPLPDLAVLDAGAVDGDAVAVHDGADDSAAGDASSLCAPTATAALDQWTFDTTAQGWSYTFDTGVRTTLSWTGLLGQPSAGALAFDVTPRAIDAGGTSGAWLQYDTPLGDLTGRIVSAWAWLDSGTSPHLKVFAQTGSQYVWADNGTVTLAPHVWTCVSLPISSPSYDQAAFDPTDVVRIGFEMIGTEAFDVVVDTVTVY
jgi:hypothetical protein